ncbi:hypothetical protein [Salinibaculum rarum]|uniref:hypothetical protein n=1 Tax=Salinibaculum rarum TaxID=3058903 RepID=UPI00265F404A|nr:hypothetical protein [Salinibaculum sp. KK48]
MTEQLEEFRDALASGDPDEVNPVIEELKEMEAEERAELFDDAFEMCLELYEDGDGYQRQSVVRFARELAPRRRLFDVIDQAASEAELSDHLVPSDTTQALDRLEEFYLTALDDDDGRVRRAAIKGLKNLTVAYQMTGLGDRIDELLARLDEMIVEASGKKLEHIQQAQQDVQFSKGPTLKEMISEGLNDE